MASELQANGTVRRRTGNQRASRAAGQWMMTLATRCAGDRRTMTGTASPRRWRRLVLSVVGVCTVSLVVTVDKRGTPAPEQSG